MRVIRFVDRIAKPRSFPVGVELDGGVEKIKFEIPHFSDLQTALIFWQNDDVADVDALVDGVWTVGQSVTANTGNLECYISVSASGVALWHSADFIARVTNLADIEGRVQQIYPGAVQAAMDAVEANNYRVGHLEANAVRGDIYQTLSAEQKTKARSNINMNFIEGDPGWTAEETRTAEIVLNIANLAARYDPTESYTVGAVVSFETAYYRCSTATGGTDANPEDFDWDKWTWIPVNPQMVSYAAQALSSDQQRQARLNIGMGLIDDYPNWTAAQKKTARQNIGLAFIDGDPNWTAAQTRNAEVVLNIANLAPRYSETKDDYGEGDCVAFETSYYLFLGWPEGETPAALGEWDWDRVEGEGDPTATKYWRWIPVNPQTVGYNWQDLTLQQKAQARMNINVGSLAAEYDETHTGYAAGDCVIYQSSYYRCIRGITGAAGEWDWDKVSGVGDPAETKYWEGVAVTPEIVSYGAQTLTDARKSRARQNILANSTGIEPEWFGAVGDGVTNDVQALQYAFNEAALTGVPVSMKAGAVYGVGGTYPWISKRIQVYGNGATIKALDDMSEAAASCVLSIHADEGQAPSLPGMGLIENLILDCNGKANIGLLITAAQGFQVRGIEVRTPKVCGIHVNSGFEVFVSSVRVAGADPYNPNAESYPAHWRTIYYPDDTGVGTLYESKRQTSAALSSADDWEALGTVDSAHTVGVKAFNNDSHYTDIVTKNMGTAVSVGTVEDGTAWGGGADTFTRVHSWNVDPAIIPTSVMFDVYSSTQLSDCYCDTCAVTVRLNGAVAVEAKGLYILHGGDTYMAGMTGTVFGITSASQAARVRAFGMIYLSPTESYELFSVDPGSYADGFPWAAMNDTSVQAMDNFPT